MIAALTKIKTILLILVFIYQINFSQSIRFNHLTVKEGFSNNKVNTLIQDQYGYLWFGTEDGLNRYDGYNFKIFRNNPNDSTSISDNSIWALTEDSNGNIWVGTKNGILNKYNSLSENFARIEIESDRTNQNSITTIYEDTKGNIWFGTRRDGIYKLDQTTNDYEHWNRDTTNENSLSFFSIRAIVEDNNGNILVGTYKGFNKFNTNSPQKGFKQYYSIENNPNSLIDNQIYNLSKSSNDLDIIWIGTPKGLTKYNSKKDKFTRIYIPNPNNIQFGSGASTVIEDFKDGEKNIWTDTYGGLIRLNLNTGKAIRFTHNQIDPYSIVSNEINKILEDRLGIIWIATTNGISYFTPKSLLFNNVLNPNLNSFLSVNKKQKDITAISKAGDKTIWLGFSDGVGSIDLLDNSSTFKNFTQLKNLNVWSLKSEKNILWIGTFGQGLKKFNTVTGKLESWNDKHPELTSNASKFVKTVFTDSKGNLWAGFWGLGLAKVSPNGEYMHWTTEPGNEYALTLADVWTIKEDELGRIWIGTQGGGLNLFENKNGGIFHHWLQQKNNRNTLSSNVINTIYVSKNKNDSKFPKTTLWIGTTNGLNKFEIINKNFDSNIYDFEEKITVYTINDGLPDNSVNSIIEDDNGNLWLGTGSGISLFIVSENSFISFTSADGIIGTEMNPESALKLDNGLMLFGSTEGLNVLDPKKIKRSNYNPSLVFTDFQLFNESIEIEKNSLLQKSLNVINKIELDYDQDVFSIEFAALDYNSPKSIKYAYKMEGFDDDWIESGSRRFVTYTNLDPGSYIFKVKSTNADGIWSDNETLLNILVNPPWWQTVWANTAFVFLIILGLYAIRRFELNRTKLRNELKLKEFEVKQKSELEEIKSRFFANLSHEFRTPLMLIKGPLEELKNKKYANMDESIDLIERNSNRLKELIDQLLELSQLEKAAIPLKAREENLILLLKGLVSSFESLAEQKKINLKFESNLEFLTCWIDKDKFEKIINNLLSNAVKFTPENGNIKVSIRKKIYFENEIAEVIISDTGISIPKEKLDQIFNRFFQVDDSEQRSYSGYGIGLSLVKEFVDLHKWQINVNSEVGKGTEFKLYIPLGEVYLSEEEKIKNAAAYEITSSEKNNIVYPKGDTIENTETLYPIKPSILIVDDSEDVRQYLKGLLEEKYSIIEAENGIDGITVATEKIPDLIISDVMMPSMDGIEFCSKVKTEWQTSDIPVILLTAKASFESKLEGLQIGADDYLTKPFDSRELFTRIENLLEQRKRLRNKYNKNLDTKFRSDKLSTADNELIKKALEVIDKNIDKTNFGTEQLAKELFMSRTKLHRKILEITTQPPGEFIRIHKLKKAAKLLIEDKLSVTQIAYEIGFSSPAQFTRAFSKQFDSLPSEFKSKYRPLK